MKRLLYVEDDPINAFILERLVKSNYLTLHVEDGESCLDLLTKEKFDAVLMDINLGNGKIDGVETMKRIKAIPHFHQLPVIAVTSYAMPEDKARFLEAGFNGYLPKPLDRPVLLEYLGKFVG
jgi:CheY-like chemotaxis protein